MKKVPELEMPMNANERFLHAVAIRLDAIIEQNNSIIEHLAKESNVAVEERVEVLESVKEEVKKSTKKKK